MLTVECFPNSTFTLPSGCRAMLVYWYAKPELTGDIIVPPKPHLRLIRHDIGCSPTQVAIDCIITLLTDRSTIPRI